MKYLALLLFVSCGLNSSPAKKYVYLTNGYLCDKLVYTTSAPIVYNCEHIGTGSVVPEIINATNIQKIEVASGTSVLK